MGERGGQGSRTGWWRSSLEVSRFGWCTREDLHALLNAWADIIPAHFEIHPLIDAAAATRYLGRRKSPERG